MRYLFVGAQYVDCVMGRADGGRGPLGSAGTGAKALETIGNAGGIPAESRLDAFAPSLYTSRHPIQVEWTMAVRFRAAAF
jgi:hypothetical protein